MNWWCKMFGHWSGKVLHSQRQSDGPCLRCGRSGILKLVK